MKKLLMSLVCLCCISSAAKAFIFMGRPAADLERGQVGIGANYSYSEADITIEGVGVDDVEFHGYLARVAYGIADEWDVFASIGAAHIDAMDSPKPTYGKQTAVQLQVSPVNVNEYVRLRAIRKGIPLYEAIDGLLVKAIKAETRREKRLKAEIPAQKEAPPAATGG